MTAKNETTINVTRMGISLRQGTILRRFRAGMRAVNTASRPESAVASPMEGIMKGSTIIMNMPNPKPQTLWVRLAPSDIKNTMTNDAIDIF